MVDPGTGIPELVNPTQCHYPAMDTDRWNKVKEIFNKACELPGEERPAFVRNACGGDEQLEIEIIDLLRTDGGSSTLFDNILLIPSETATEEPVESVYSEKIGPYKIIQELGRGGMGVVYLVERADDQYRKRMALKLVKRGMDTDDILQRFRSERQILASLEHPNIARLYDGGATSDGRPYLVMEYVDGESILTYCDRSALSIDERLKLFITVCKGVQYAHQHLIVHRDLKPSNILVTGEGDVRLVDFGIAKLLQDSAVDDRAYTRPWARRITPQYASPEQFAGERITTASDVYSLGIILYELLTGTHPYRDASGNNTFGIPGTSRLVESPASRILKTGAEEIYSARRTTKHALHRRIKNDLEAVVLTALHPEPQHRYQSAEQLLWDIERHLNRHPVSAHPPSTAYRMSKFISRNRAASASAFGLFLMTVIFVIFSWIQQIQTAHERDIARIERDKAQDVVVFLQNLMSAADPAFGGERADTLRLRDFVTRSTEKVRNELSAQPVIQAQMLNILGNVHQNLGMHEQARTLLEEALAMRTNIYGREHPEVAESMNDLGVLLDKMGAYDDAEKYIRGALALRLSLLGSSHDAVAGSLTDLANLVHDKGNYDEAEAHYREALAVNTQVHGEFHQKTAVSIANLATILQRKGDLDEAESQYRKAMAIYEEFLGGEHPLVAGLANNLGLLLTDRGELEEAETLLHRALTMRRKIYGEVHPLVLSSLNNLASIIADRGNYSQAEIYYRESLLLRIKVHGEQSMPVAGALNNLADIMQKTGQFDEAIAHSRKALATAREAVGSGHPAIGIISGNLASKLQQRGSVSEAKEIYEGALALLKKNAAAGSSEHRQIEVGIRSMSV
jgi:eukaryotic-like serine/threonine-protein kinase